SAELATIAERLQQAYPVTNGGRQFRAMTLRESTAGGSTWILLSLLGVIGLILGRSLRLMAVGVCIGAAAGWAIGMTIRGSLLFGVSAADPLTYALVLGLLGVSGLVARCVPARRAISIDPMTVLKRE